MLNTCKTKGKHDHDFQNKPFTTFVVINDQKPVDFFYLSKDLQDLPENRKKVQKC